MNKGITNRQLFFIIIMTLTTVSISNIPSMMVKIAGTGSWVTLMCTALIFSFFAINIVRLNNKFQGQTIFEYGQIIIGKVITYIITIIYIIYFFAIVTNLTCDLSRTLKSNFLIETPIIATLIGTIAICCYGAYKGVTNVARLIEIFGVVFLISALFVHISMLFQGEIQFILPFYIKEDTGIYFASIKDTIFPFLGIEILTIIPLSKHNGKKAEKVAFFSLICVGILYVLIVESSIMMIGINEIVYYEQSMLAAIRVVEFSKIEFLKRIDAIFLIAGLGGVLVGIMVGFTTLVEFISKLFKKVKRAILSLMVGIIALIISLIIFNIQNYEKFFKSVFTLYGLVVAAFIPTILLLLAKVKKNVQTKN